MENQRQSVGRRFFDLFIGLGKGSTGHASLTVKDDFIQIDLNSLMAQAPNSFMESLCKVLDGCDRDGLWPVGETGRKLVRQDLSERLPGLLCDIGGLQKNQVTLVLGSKMKLIDYHLEYCVKGTRNKTKRTQLFISNLTPKKGTDTMQTQPQKPLTMTVTLNEFMTPQGIDLNFLKTHLVNTGFFIDELDATAVINTMVPSMPLLTQLIDRYTVTAKLWERKEIGHPGWEFTCVDRYTIELGSNGFVAGVTDSMVKPTPHPYGMFNNSNPPLNPFNSFSPNRMFMMPGGPMDPYGRVTNNDIVGLLELYSLTQIRPMPAQMRGANNPAGLELLELVKERLAGPRYVKDHMGAWQKNPEFSMPAGPGNYANERYNSFGHAEFPFSPFMGAMTNVNNRYHAVIAGSKVGGYDLTPLGLPRNERFVGMAIDTYTGNVAQHTTNLDTKGSVVYNCTSIGNLLQRLEYPEGAEWVQYPGLIETLGSLKYPLQTFKFQVSDTIEDTFDTLITSISELRFTRNGHQTISDEVKAALASKPISSSEFTVLNFAYGLVAAMPEGLQVAFPDSAIKGWIIYTDLSNEELIPDRFWLAPISGSATTW